jgi:hypothetical protein
MEKILEELGLGTLKQRFAEERIEPFPHKVQSNPMLIQRAQNGL